MRIKKMTGLIYEIEATFIARNIRNDEFKFDTIIRFPIDISNIADLSNYNLFLYDYFLNQNIDDLFIYDNPPDIEEFVTSLNNLTRCVLIDNIHKLEVHLRDESILDENEEILDIYDVTILDTLNLRVIEGEVLTVLSADVDIQGSVTRQGFQEVRYKEYVDISCDCNENEYYVGPCDCERGYYEEGIHEEFVKEEIFEISDSCLTNIDISNADISNVDINDKESLINKLKQVYSEYIANTFNTNYRDDSGICIHNKSTVEISNFTLNSIEIKRTLINCSSEEFKINYIWYIVNLRSNMHASYREDIIAICYAFVDKFLSDDDFEKIVEVLKMTEIGKKIIEETAKEKAIEFAKGLLLEGFTPEKVSKFPGIKGILTLEEIKKLGM